MYPKTRKVADDDNLWQIALGNAGKVGQRLSQCRIQIFAARLLHHQQHAGPEQIDEAVGFGRKAGHFLTACSKVATRLSVMPKISKKSIQNGLLWLSSLAASAQVRLKVSARDLISFQDMGMVGSRWGHWDAVRWAYGHKNLKNSPLAGVFVNFVAINIYDFDLGTRPIR